MDFVFYSGETKRLKVRLNKMVCGFARPYSVNENATVTFILPATPSDLEIEATVSNFDLGEAYVDLSAANTTAMVSGDLIIKIENSGTVRFARKAGTIRKLKK